jgi:hypothetical protein
LRRRGWPLKHKRVERLTAAMASSAIDRVAGEA